jgi:heme/copper-type cytochrome/quinol oxidase subunit 2
VSIQAFRVATAGLLLALAGGGASPQEEIRIEASRAGFKPKVVNLRKGDRVRLVLTTADAEHCFAVDELRIEKRIVRGKATTVELTVDRSGTYAFHCCLEAAKERGQIVVSE